MDRDSILRENLERIRAISESFEGSLEPSDSLIIKAIETQDLEKGKRAAIGEIREWSGKKYQKTASGWEYVGNLNENKKEIQPTPSKGKEKEPTNISGSKYPGLTKEQRSKVVEVKPSSDREFDRAKTIIEFDDPRLMNLFANEIRKQISDGQWENSLDTEWMRDVAFRLGPETKVTTTYTGSRKKSFPLNKKLRETVGERATEEAGYPSVEEMSEGWRKINNAISQAEEVDDFGDDIKEIRERYRIAFIERRKKLQSELLSKGYKKGYFGHLDKSIGKVDGVEVYMSISVPIDPLDDDEKGLFVNASVECRGKKITNPFKEYAKIEYPKLPVYEKAALELLEKIN